jgi:hypothetical protein
LGFDFQNHEFYASDCVERIYEFAIKLIKKGKAYICDLSVAVVNGNIKATRSASDILMLRAVLSPLFWPGNGIAKANLICQSGELPLASGILLISGWISAEANLSTFSRE